MRPGTRSGVRREEGLFALAGEPLTVSVESSGDGAAEAVLESARAVLRDAESNLAAVLEHERLQPGARPPVRIDGRGNAGEPVTRSLPLVTRMRGRLPEQAVAEICAHLDAIAEIFVRHKLRRRAGGPRRAALRAGGHPVARARGPAPGLTPRRPRGPGASPTAGLPDVARAATIPPSIAARRRWGRLRGSLAACGRVGACWFRPW